MPRALLAATVIGFASVAALADIPYTPPPADPFTLTITATPQPAPAPDAIVIYGQPLEVIMRDRPNDGQFGDVVVIDTVTPSMPHQLLRSSLRLFGESSRK